MVYKKQRRTRLIKRGIVMRYTKKSEKFINAYEWNRELPTKTFVQLGMNKLGQHEDIEDEFGIEILTVVEAVKKGFYDRTGAFHDPYTFSIDLESSCLRETYINETAMCPIPDVFYFDEYGKGWALTKEELL